MTKWATAIILSIACIIGVIIINTTIESQLWGNIGSAVWILCLIIGYFRFFAR